MKDIHEFDETNEIEEVNHYGLAKIKIMGNYIGPNITRSETGGFVDSYGNTYKKNYIRKTLMIEYTSKSDLRNRIKIKNFKEGNYGLWLERVPPYYIKGGELLGRYEGLKDSPDSVKGESENGYLNSEERIIDDFLWIQAGEKLVFPKDAEEFDEEESAEAEEAERRDREEDAREAEAEASSQAGSSSSSEDGSEEESESEDESESSGNSASTLSLPSLNCATPTGGGSPIVVQGATCMCAAGTAPGKLFVLSNQTVMADKKNVATIADGTPANFTPFGGCLPLTNVYGVPPCSLAVTGQWICADGGFMVNGTPVLTTSGTLMCAIGGVITIVEPGQAVHLTKKG